VVGTVPAARPEHVRDAFAQARAFKPKLTRYERQQILQRTAEALRDRKEEFARLITAESGLCWKDSLYEASRAYDVWSFAAQLTIKDDGEIYSCDISPNGKARKIYTTRLPLLGVISAITPVQPPAQHGEPQARPGHRHQQPRRPEADGADPPHGAGARRRALRGRAAARDAVGGDGQSLHDGGRHDHRPGRRPRDLHGLGARRQAHRRHGRLQAPCAGARRQRSPDRHGGRRPRPAADLAVQGATKNSASAAPP
jgi:hypothetical protein